MFGVNRSTAAIVMLCGMILLLLCGAAYAQELPPTTQTGEEPVPGQTGEEPAPGHVYFYLDGELAPVERDVAGGGGQMAEFGINELLKGPTEEEKAAGYVTYIPEGTKLQYSTIKMDYSEYGANLSRELLELSGDKDKAAKALTQIEKTLQELTGIETISITVAAEGTGSEPEDAYVALGVTRQGGKEAGTSEGSGKTGLVVVIVLIVLILGLLVFLMLYIPKRRKGDGGKSAPEKKTAAKRDKK